MPPDPAESARARLRLFAAEYALGMRSSGELPPIADAALSAGVYCDALFELSCITYSIHSEVGPLLDAALRQLGIAAPTRTEAIWLTARACVEAILEPEPSTDLHAGLDRLVELVRIVRDELPGTSCADIGLPNTIYPGSNIDAAMLFGLADTYDDVIETFNAQDAAQVALESQRRAELDERVRAEARRWLERHPA